MTPFLRGLFIGVVGGIFVGAACVLLLATFVLSGAVSELEDTR